MRQLLNWVPLDPELSVALRDHMECFPPVEVMLPWLTPTGPKVTHRPLFTSGICAAIWSPAFNDQAWKPALAAAGIIPAPENGERYAAAREHGMHALRHFYASVLLDAGESSLSGNAYRS
ncbi:integrase [Streptomyces luteogriseus]|uniref:Integrase n=1 Tax=Streptomyces luteogriseus TaxID=68233 RepID=A0A7W7GL52_9ACTN|nr:integrase [Streptomyces luteogriseus]